jgi:broad-specificity NMP kinase
MRTSPNVIVTGTPGVGKTVHCEQLAQDIGLKHLSVNQVAKERDCYESYDEERKSWVVDEDKVWLFVSPPFGHAHGGRTRLFFFLSTPTSLWRGCHS